MAKWVKHKSGQGEKWSEYIEYEGPGVWKDISVECDLLSFEKPWKGFQQLWHGGNRLFDVGNELVTQYRLRKVEIENSNGPGCRWAFMVERRHDR